VTRTAKRRQLDAIVIDVLTRAEPFTFPELVKLVRKRLGNSAWLYERELYTHAIEHQWVL
jgi:hypothetical protein